uniref:Uncharacterized protein n=1 Tax=Poecilia reticulata TaxID=8081 RepID=A0A3P9P7K3_POERE
MESRLERIVSARFVRLHKNNVSLTYADEYVTTSPSGVGTVTVQRCKPGQFLCHGSEECIPVSLLCDGQPNCKDYSDETNCGEIVPHYAPSGTTTSPAVTPWRPLVPRPCSPKQFSCDSGECVHKDRRCDLQRDCIDGSDEKDCGRCYICSSKVVM